MRCISPEMALGGHAVARLTSALWVLSCLAARKNWRTEIQRLAELSTMTIATVCIFAEGGL